jgi:hypothetical protein
MHRRHRSSPIVERAKKDPSFRRKAEARCSGDYRDSDSCFGSKVRLDTAFCGMLALIDVTICVTPQQRLIGRALYSRLSCSITRNVSHRSGRKQTPRRRRRKFSIQFSNSQDRPRPSLRNQRRECVPDDKVPREQSIKPQRKMDCFASLAMTSKQTTSRSQRNAPELCIYSSPKMEGAGNAGCPLHPQPPVQCRKHRGRSHRYPGTPGIPCAMVLTAYVGLSPVTGLFCHRHLAD